ncbi:MAG: TetR family transcriptional regulator [Acidimicrobiales bacterium]|jgi:AcrR family transcriptional regulator
MPPGELSSASSDEGFTISVLAERTGTPVPTIHHYRHLGLLPEATELASNRFLYDERHVEALNAIRVLRERRNMPLEVIREALPELLAFDHESGFEPDSWDEVVAEYLERSGPAAVSARLVEVARSAFAQHGYAGVNVADICAAADVAKGTFYRYFDSKEAIFIAAARSTVDAVGEQLDSSPAPMSEPQAIERLKLLLAPMAPLLLEVATGELRHQPNLVGVVGVITAGLASRVVPRLRTRGRAARPAARRVVDAALVGLLQPTLESATSPST